MPEWLGTTSLVGEADVVTVFTRLLLAWGAGWLIARIAVWRSPRETADTLPATLILMSILIAMATQIIGDNVARAFSLVGALSIVRFRTAVPSSRDVAFVLASVVVGMAIGAGQYAVAAIGILVVAVATRCQTQRPITDSEIGNALDDAGAQATLTIQVGLAAGGRPQETLAQTCDRVEMLSAATARKGAAMTYVYALTLKPGVTMIELLQQLNRLPDVESLSWQR